MIYFQANILQRSMPFLVVLLMLAPLLSIGQESCSSSSGEGQSGTGSIAWTLGQTAYMTSTGSNGSQIQGVQQPYELQFFPGIDEQAPAVKPWFTLYPNPGSEVCRLKISDHDQNGSMDYQGLHFELHDMNGQKLLNQEIKEGETIISLGILAKGTYLVSLWKTSTCLQISKLIKR
jgi:hypothetical protein